MQIELRVVQFFDTIELELLIFFVSEVKLHSEWIVTDLVTIALLEVPESFFLITVEDVLAVDVQDLAIVVFNFVYLLAATLLFYLLPTFSVHRAVFTTLCR